MANKVSVSVQAPIPVRHTDIIVRVEKDGGKLGTLLISKGSVEWRPKGTSVNRRVFGWGKFAAIMEEHGRSARKGKVARQRRAAGKKKAPRKRRK